MVTSNGCANGYKFLMPKAAQQELALMPSDSMKFHEKFQFSLGRRKEFVVAEVFVNS